MNGNVNQDRNRDSDLDNLYENVPADSPEELIETLLSSEKVRLQRIISMGDASPDDFWYDQPDDEWVVVLKGEAKLRFEGAAASIMMRPGDHLIIPAHQKHRVEWTTPKEPTIWLALHWG
jgi:cupin 2 domain-containing protein